MNHLVSLAEAEALASPPGPAGTESVPIALAAGRVAAATLRADRDFPPYPRTMMDGIAFPSAQLSPDGRFAIAGLHAAGDPPPRPLPPGHAWEIMTGACVPPDCDTVVPYEDFADGRVTGKIAPGRFIHAPGSDAGAGAPLVAPGARLGPVEIAIAASIGAVEIEVFRRPRVALLSTGDEAIPPTEEPQPWQIRRSHGPMLESMLLRRGGTPVFREHAPDCPDRCGALLDRALSGCDLLLVCGGISKGKKDLIRPLLESRLGAPRFHGVAQRPGRPLAFWPGPPAVFALPGNPLSVLAAFARHVLPAMAAMEGAAFTPLPVVLGGEVHPLAEESRLLPVAPGPDGVLRARTFANSGDFISAAGAVGIVEIPPAPSFVPGTPLRFFPFNP